MLLAIPVSLPGRAKQFTGLPVAGDWTVRQNNVKYSQKTLLVADMFGDAAEYNAESINDESKPLGGEIEENYITPAEKVAALATDDEVSAYYGIGDKKKEEKFQERVVQIRRVTKVVKGGKQLSFRAVVIIGDEKGQVGVGVASAKEVIGAVAKAVTDAKRNLITVSVTRYQSIAHYIEGRAGASCVMLRPASEGTGVVAGGATRVVLEMAGLKNIFGKQLGADSPLNNARATIEGLKELRTFPQVATERGISLEQLIGKNTSESNQNI